MFLFIIFFSFFFLFLCKQPFAMENVISFSPYAYCTDAVQYYMWWNVWEENERKKKALKTHIYSSASDSFVRKLFLLLKYFFFFFSLETLLNQFYYGCVWIQWEFSFMELNRRELNVVSWLNLQSHLKWSFVSVLHIWFQIESTVWKKMRYILAHIWRHTHTHT